MRRIGFIIVLSLILSSVLLASFILIQEVSKPGDIVPFTTLEKGFVSGYRYDDYTYAGEYMVIRNQSAWTDFWYEHRGGQNPQQPVPSDIDWDRQMVLVAMYGFVSDCCDRYIKFTETRREGDTVYAYVREYDEKWDITYMMVTNPYHIIVLEKATNVVFTENEPEYGGLWWDVLLLIIVAGIVELLDVGIRRKWLAP